MRQLREVLGPDAVILSNRAVDGGVEVLAIPAEDIAAMAPPVVDMPTLSPTSAQMPREKTADLQSEPNPEVSFKRRLVERVALPSEDGAQLAKSVISEIKMMQSRLENQLADLAWRDLPGRDPSGATLMRDMLAAGFSATLARELLDSLPRGEARSDTEQAQIWMRNTLMKRLQVIQN
jgi:flagellar biosynthesis protein FlhF